MRVEYCVLCAVRGVPHMRPNNGIYAPPSTSSSPRYHYLNQWEVRVSDQSDINAAQNNRFPTICEGRQSSVQRGAVKDVKVSLPKDY